MTADRPRFSSRIAAVSESRTTRIFAQADALRRKGREIISLAVGEPDFATPDAVIAATRQALTDQCTRYGPVPGEPELRCRLADAFDGLTADHIIVTNGAKQALFALFQVLCSPGDEVIVPVPCWVSFTEQIRLAGATPVMVATDERFQIDPDRVAREITPRTRAILVNSPNNPTGAVYPAETMTTLARLAADKGFYLIADEAYHAFVYDGQTHAAARDAAPDPDRVITVRSFSKHYNMTGFRIGYVAAEKNVIQALTRLQSHLSGNVCT
ncbi:MAG: aminotransferase class I/II-fold pyridoxal phosphate-dependent enzyme, partial [Desulfatitalea sp.]|nr:aminotransferase class I/II-fold pyridoxal phosphate-dependent enzyme [Desulfatitalea sp.]